MAGVDILGIGCLHLGPKSHLLEQAGYRTVGDVRETARELIIRIPGLGKQTTDELVRKRGALLRSVTADGEIDWQAYCTDIDIPLLPLGCQPKSGAEFLRCLPIFLEGLATHLPERILATILRERIYQPPDRQTTLEQIADEATPRLTRERIRQKEKRLLGQITGGLLNNNYEGLDIHFHPMFSVWWQKAADALSGLNEIEVRAFVDMLCRVWNVPPSSVMDQLPAIVAIVTGEPQMSRSLRQTTRIDPKLFLHVRSELGALAIVKLRIGKTAARLTTTGLPSVGEVIATLHAGELGGLGEMEARRITEHLSLIAETISADGSVDWEAYRQAVGLACLPATPPATPADFVGGLRVAVEELLHLHLVTKRAKEIYRRRTGQDTDSRLTIERTAEELGTFGSIIKREETIFLRWLSDVLVAREFWSLNVWLESAWLAYWADAFRIFGHTQMDYGLFVKNLAWQWRLSVNDVQNAAPTLWSVFKGYPDGRPSARKSRFAISVNYPDPTRIRLRGFRRLH